MNDNTEQKLKYNWPIWFAENFNEILTQGQMAELDSTEARFTCYTEQCPRQGQQLTVRFSVPAYDSDGAFDLENVLTEGNVANVEKLNPFMETITLKFNEPLHFKPGECQNETTEQITAIA